MEKQAGELKLLQASEKELQELLQDLDSQLAGKDETSGRVRMGFRTPPYRLLTLHPLPTCAELSTASEVSAKADASTITETEVELPGEPARGMDLLSSYGWEPASRVAVLGPY